MVRWVALSLGCLFLLPSCLGGCGFRWPDDPSSYDRDTWHRDHEDEGEDVAVDLCWGVTCEVGGTCDPLTGECSHPHPCEWLECGPCELCDWDEEECVSLCGAEECCYDGQCAICGTWCDPDCGPCEICEDDRCSSTCAEGEVCFLEACCLPDCEGLECGDDGCGGSCGVCDSEATEYCTREQRCEDIPTCGGCPGCLRDRECCDAGVIDELRIATGPDAETGDPGCCCDYDGDGIADNALATLVANVGSMADLNLDDVNALVAESIASGAFLVLLDYLCFQGDEPLDYVVVNLLLGEDLDDDPSDNFDGEETFTFHPDSLNDDGDPLFEFRGAEIGDDGVFRAPGGGGFSGQFFVPPLVPGRRARHMAPRRRCSPRSGSAFPRGALRAGERYALRLRHGRPDPRAPERLRGRQLRLPEPRR